MDHVGENKRESFVELDLMAMATQFGMSGLIAWMWLSERRSAAVRERQLAEAHERLMQQRVQLDALIQVVTDNARAAMAVEAGQRALIGLMEAVLGKRAPRGPNRQGTEAA